MKYGINPSALINYITSIRRLCMALQSSQNDIELSFTRLEESWNDNIYKNTNLQLFETAKNISRIYSGLGDSVLSAARYVNRQIEIQEYRIDKVSEAMITVFRSKLLDRSGSMSSIDKVNIVNIDAMRDFEKTLSAYIEDTQQTLSAIKREHIRVGEEGSWDSPQYNQFGEIIDEVYSKMQVSLRNLSVTKMIVTKKRQELETEYNKKI